MDEPQGLDVGQLTMQVPAGEDSSEQSSDAATTTPTGHDVVGNPVAQLSCDPQDQPAERWTLVPPAYGHDCDASARVNEAPEYVTEPSDVKWKTYDEEAGNVDTGGIEEPDHNVEVQPSGVVTQSLS